jgi:hypothetical protein
MITEPPIANAVTRDHIVKYRPSAGQEVALSTSGSVRLLTPVIWAEWRSASLPDTQLTMQQPDRVPLH